MQRAAIMCVHFRDCDWPNCPEKRAIHLLNDMAPGSEKGLKNLLFTQAEKLCAAFGRCRRCV